MFLSNDFTGILYGTLTHQVSVDKDMIRVHFVDVELVEDGLLLVGQGVGPELGLVQGREWARLGTAV